MLDVGWPDPAAVLHRTESTRNCWASSWMSSKVCTVMAVSSHCRLSVTAYHDRPPKTSPRRGALRPTVPWVVITPSGGLASALRPCSPFPAWPPDDHRLTDRRNLPIRCGPACTGSYRGCSPGSRQVGRHEICADQLAFWK